MSEEETRSPRVEPSASAQPPRPAAAPPRLWPVLVILAFQGLYLVGLHVLASRYPVTAEVVPLDALALPGSPVEIRVRLRAAGYPSTPSTLEGIVVLLAPEDPGEPWTSDDDAPGGAARWARAETDAEGIASWSLTAPENPGVHVLRARVDPDGFESSAPPSTEVLLEVAPADAAIVLIKVPDTIERDLELPESIEREASPAADALREIARFASVAYVLDPAWSEARNVLERLEARGFPRAPVLRDRPGSGAGSSLTGGILRLLDLSRRRGALWGVLRDRDEVAGFVASGFRVILLGAKDSPAPGSDGVRAAPTWAHVRRTIAK